MQFIHTTAKFTPNKYICLSFYTDAWQPTIGIHGVIKSLQSIFVDDSVEGIAINTNVDPHAISVSLAPSQRYKCKECGADHAALASWFASVVPRAALPSAVQTEVVKK